MFKRSNLHYSLRKGPANSRTSWTIVMIPLILIIGIGLVFGLPRMLSHTENSTSPSNKIARPLSAVSKLSDNKTSATASQAPNTEAVHTDAPKASSTEPEKSVSNKPSASSSAKPASSSGKQAVATDCNALVAGLTHTLAGTVQSANNILTNNMHIFGLDLIQQNTSIDSYNKNVKAAYDSSVHIAHAAGCTFTTAAPTQLSHKTQL
jgi:hypothetical protein